MIQRAIAVAVSLVLIAVAEPGSAQQPSAATPPEPVAAAAASASAGSEAALKRTERDAEAQRKLTDQRLRRRELDAKRYLGSICKGC